ncbi:serine/threonine protein kinase [Pseudoxanthomonas sp. PXM03]|uniref:serine/threonine-protein kinase n=1 Tax=Pseudoxanthomonas sp. PXM03 TaxID=2769284 RepID=UPI0017809203|nr:serine/threonine-protein kinase [Pseudoxanthomonas sp. PXM03]MBD9438142.1 serine/threonine protein kinase [Pseudoxanthomonas sp. PXM03]
MSDLAARALELFDAYVDLTPSQRCAALARLRKSDPALHDALHRLLVADAAEHALQSTAFDALIGLPEHDDADLSSSRIGNRLGPWRIDGVLGTGGMGTVYEASRVDGQYNKRVALKCIRAEMSSPALIDAFMRERNHLAQLDHPHIAALLDGGIEEDGRPWFAMRLVDGISIDLWADQQRLTLHERVALLLQACKALQYAHAHGVLHQDIKPGNMLVSTDGRVHLLDFGLSTVIDGRGGASPPRIAVSHGYTSPEVLAGGTPSAASDIYSIGVVLYQLLVADWPRPLPPLHASLVAQSATPVHAPSALAVAASADVAWKRKCGNGRQLCRRLQGDLDAIALKCVAVSPDERYAGIAALADDLERWLGRQPVAARKGGRRYVLQRFLQRNALASVLAVSVIVVAATGASVLAWFHLRDRQEMRDMQAVSALFEQTLGAATLSGLAEARPSSRQLLEKSEAHLRELQLQSSPAIKARALASLARSYALLGDYEHALALAGEANLLLADDRAHQSDTQAMLATLLNLQSRHAEARDVAAAGLQQATSTRPTADMTTLGLLTELARANWGLAEYDAAFDALNFAQETAAGMPSRVALDTHVELLILRGQWHLQLLNLPEAARDLQRAIDQAGTRSPALADNAREARLSLLLSQARHAEAGALAESLLASRRQRLGSTHPDTVRSERLQLEVKYQQPGGEAIQPAAVEKVREAIVGAYGTRHPEYARLLMLEARLRLHEDPTSALALASQASQLLEQMLGPRHQATLAAKEEQGRALIAAAGRQSDADASASLAQAIGLLQEVVHATRQHHQPSPAAKYWLAQALIQRAGHSRPADLDDRQLAEILLQDALVESSRHLGTRHAMTTHIRQSLVRNYQPDTSDSAPTALGP